MTGPLSAPSTATQIVRDVSHVTVQPYDYYLRAHRDQLPLTGLCGATETPSTRPLNRATELCAACVTQARRHHVEIVPPGHSLS